MTNLYEPFSDEKYTRYAAECARTASFAHHPDAPTFHKKCQNVLSEIEIISRLDFGIQNRVALMSDFGHSLRIN